MLDVAPPRAADALVRRRRARRARAGCASIPTQFDVYYFAPQKCFAERRRALARAAAPRRRSNASSGSTRPTVGCRRASTSSIALEKSRLDQTYNTPALATVFLLADQIEWMLDNGGLEWSRGAVRPRRPSTSTGGPRRSAFATPFVEKPRARSHVTATIDFDDAVDAAAIATALRANGIVDTEPYRKLGRNQLRIGMFPAVEPDDVATLTRAIDYVVDALA